MSPLDFLQLIGYSLGAALPLWLGVQLVFRRHSLSIIERLLFALALTIGGWHASNLFITVHGLFGLSLSQWATALRVADSISVISITFAYSVLLHIHLHLWARAKSRSLTATERVRVYLSYIPTLFLTVALWTIWTGPYAPMLTKVSFFVFPFALWIAYVLVLIAITELLIARLAPNQSEQRILRTLAVSFIGIGILILAALALGLGQGTTAGLYLQTFANLGSLLPSLLLAYYVYRYRYLELIIEESLIVATFAAVVLTIYIYGIRTAGDWLTSRYGVKSGVVEALLILGLTLVAAPFRRWLQKRFRKLFEREAALYREVVARIGSQPGHHKDLPELLRFVAARTEQALSLRQVEIVIADDDSPATGGDNAWIKDLIEISRANEWSPVEGDPLLTNRGFRIAYPVRREQNTYGVLMVDGLPASLTTDNRAVLAVLADQVAIAIQDSQLVAENVRLERQVAEGERLAALGQMAATVAHEIKNPLSAIKSIAQVMREDDELSVEYARDLSLIVGETDRLSQSVTQLLSFSRRQSVEGQPLRSDELIRSVVGLFRANADQRNIKLTTRVESGRELPGAAVQAVRDALSNLLLNALQAVPEGGRITIQASERAEDLIITVVDSGPGVSPALAERIWEPFFTTKQRGTGLGLAIVRKRLEEAGGSAQIHPSTNGEGACFELRLPLS
ncbi:MAG TPA: ATP-binding protein [Pyrinomonadaceae bacterium]|nr:ATP-binding protein [Pyrinomonadaceae bacterium]